MPTDKSLTGRSSASLQVLLRKGICSGEFSVGEMLPSVRELSRIHGLDCKTVHRALTALASEGYVIAVPRLGFRVQQKANDPRKGCPVAHVIEDLGCEQKEPISGSIRSLLHKILAERSWSLLGVYIGDRNMAEILEQIKMAHAWGVMIDTVNPKFLEMIRETRIPAVMVEAWLEGAPFDVVLQDGHQGGFIAARHLIEKGCRRIGWFGPIRESAHSHERFGGAAAALASEKIEMGADLRFESERIDYHNAAKAMLTGPDRPDGVLALWRDASIAVAEVSRSLGLKVGRDFEMVGWSHDEGYDAYAAAFDKDSIPPAVTWSPVDMAHAAIARLEERWHNPDLPLMRLNVRMRLSISRRKELVKQI